MYTFHNDSNTLTPSCLETRGKPVMGCEKKEALSRLSSMHDNLILLCSGREHLLTGYTVSVITIDTLWCNASTATDALEWLLLVAKQMLRRKGR